MLIIDAANVVGSRPTGWWRDRPGAARDLVASVRTAAAAGRIDPPVIIVLEGQARAGAPEGTADGVTVVHAPASGDDELVRQATDATARQEPQVTVVTADRDLRHRLEAVGAHVVGPSWLLTRIAQIEQP